MKKKQQTPICLNKTVYEFPYFGDKTGFSRIFAVRALLSCLLCVFCTAAAAKELQLEQAYVPAVLIGGAVCLVFVLLHSFFRTGYVLIFGAAAGGITALVRWDEIVGSARCFWNYLMNFIHEGGIIPARKLLVDIQPEQTGDENAFFLYLTAVLAFAAASCTVKRFWLFSAAVPWSILMLPAFMAQQMKFCPELALSAAAIAFFVAAEIGYESTAMLVYGKRRYLDEQDGNFTRQNRRETGPKRLRRQTEYYGRYTPTGITAFLSVLLTMCIAASAVPADSFADFSRIGKAASEIFSGMTDVISDLIYGPGLRGNGFFTADSGGNITISNSVSAANTSQSEEIVLQVTVDDLGEPVYLRGDVGYIYENEGWKSISSVDYDNIYCGDMTAGELFDTYATDLTYSMLHRKLSLSGLDPDDYIAFRRIIVDYVKRTKTIFMPSNPYETTFRDSGLYHSQGDFVSYTDRAGAIKSFEVLAFCSRDNWVDYFMREPVDYDYIYSHGNEVVSGLPYGEYKQLDAYYKAYINEMYLDVAESERENIKLFLEEVSEFSYPSASSAALNLTGYEEYYYSADRIADEQLSDYNTALKICSYLSESGRFRYSLTADNTSGENTYLGSFLFDTRQGHCALYATAMTLALRELGIPARYVTGFAVNGDYDRTVAQGYQYDIRQKQLHAWVEVYIDELCWVTFVPTPADANNAANPAPAVTEESSATTATEPAEETTEAEPDRTTSSHSEGTTATSKEPEQTSASGSSGETPEQQPDFGETAGKILIVIAAAAVVAFAVVLVRYGLAKLERNRRTLFGSFRNDDLIASVGLMLGFNLRLLRMLKIQRASGELPMAFAQRVDGQIKLSCTMTEIMPVFEHTEFQRRENIYVTEQDREAVYRYTAELTEYALAVSPPVRVFRKLMLFRKSKM